MKFITSEALRNNDKIEVTIDSDFYRTGVITITPTEITLEIKDVEEVIATDKWHSLGDVIKGEEKFLQIAGEVNRMLREWKPFI